MPDSSEFPDFSRISAIEALMAEVCALEGGSVNDIVGIDRRPEAVRPRHAAMWLAFKLSPCSLTEIGRAFHRHHSTVLYGVRAHERRLARDAAANARSHALLSRLFVEAKEAGEPPPIEAIHEPATGEGARP